MPTSTPVACQIFLHIACKLYSGPEKSNHPRQIVVSANGICLGHIPCFVLINQGPIACTRWSGESIEPRNICGCHAQPE